MPTKSNNTGGRGGARPGAGRKKSAVKEKAENGNPGGRRLEVLDTPEVEGVDMPKPHEFLSAEQRDGSTLQAEEIYTETWEWLKKVGCAAKVSPQLLERYAMCSARWIDVYKRQGQEFFPAHGVCADILPAGLVDGKADLSDIVDAIEHRAEDVDREGDQGRGRIFPAYVGNRYPFAG